MAFSAGRQNGYGVPPGLPFLPTYGAAALAAAGNVSVNSFHREALSRWSLAKLLVMT